MIKFEIIKTNEGEFPCLLCGKISKSVSENEEKMWKKSFLRLAFLVRHLKGSCHCEEQFLVEQYIACIEKYEETIKKRNREERKNEITEYESPLKRRKLILDLEQCKTIEEEKGILTKRIENFGMRVVNKVLMNDKMIGESFDLSNIEVPGDSIKTESFGVQKDCSLDECLDLLKIFVKKKKVWEFIGGIAKGSQVQKLWNSVILKYVSSNERYDHFSEVDVSYCRGFQYQHDRIELEIIQKLLKVSQDILLDFFLFIVGVDNCDALEEYSMKEVKYRHMMQRIIFLIDHKVLGENCLNNFILTGWSQRVILENEVILEKLTLLSDEETNIFHSHIDLLISSFCLDDLENFEPFACNPKTKNFVINESDIKTEEDLLRYFKIYLQKVGVIQVPVLDKKCVTEEDFNFGFETVVGMLPKNAKVFAVADQPGHQASRIKRPTFIAKMHVAKYLLMVGINSVYFFGFKKFQKKFGISKDSRSIPHGLLHKLQPIMYTYFFKVFVCLVQLVGKIKNTAEYSNLTELGRNKEKRKELLIILLDQSMDWMGKGKVDEACKKAYWALKDIWVNILLTFVLFKRSIRTADYNLFEICLKKSIVALARGGHHKYCKSVVDQLYDQMFLWKSEMRKIYRHNFVFLTKWGTCVPFDDEYERAIKENKRGDTTNSVTQLLLKSKMYNIFQFLKFVKKDEKIYRKKILQKSSQIASDSESVVLNEYFITEGLLPRPVFIKTKKNLKKESKEIKQIQTTKKIYEDDDNFRLKLKKKILQWICASKNINS